MTHRLKPATKAMAAALGAAAISGLIWASIALNMQAAEAPSRTVPQPSCQPGPPVVVDR